MNRLQLFVCIIIILLITGNIKAQNATEIKLSLLAKEFEKISDAKLLGSQNKLFFNEKRGFPKHWYDSKCLGDKKCFIVYVDKTTDIYIFSLNAISSIGYSTSKMVIKSKKEQHILYTNYAREFLSGRGEVFMDSVTIPLKISAKSDDVEKFSKLFFSTDRK